MEYFCYSLRSIAGGRWTALFKALGGSRIVGTSTVAGRGVKRAHNFNAGPAALPLAVLERIREELLDWRGSGMPQMEINHRPPEIAGISERTEQGFLNHLATSDDHTVAD